jgi:predicted transcriptional regulator
VLNWKYFCEIDIHKNELLCYTADMENKLLAVGLNNLQAAAYSYLLEHGETSPAAAATALGITRSNSYKLFDRLAEMNLATKKEVRKKYVYSLTNPQNISNLVADQRNIATAREEAARNLMADLLAKYHAHTSEPSITVVTGRKAVAEAYKAQIAPGESLCFIRSRSDVPIMGYEMMHDIRITPARYDMQRYGITPDITAGTTVNPASDIRSNLERTWIGEEDYTAPVEWSVSGSALLIVIFGDEPHAITIENPLVAEAFRQIWQLIARLAAAYPDYATLPRQH